MSDTENDDSSYFDLMTGGTVVGLGIIFEVAVAFVAKVVIAQYLGKVSYGAVTIGITLMAVTSTVVVLGMNTGIGRYLPRFDGAAKRRGVLVSGFLMGLPASVVAGAGVVLLAPVLAGEAFHDPSVTPILRVFGATIPLAAFVKLSVGAVRGNQDTVPMVYIRNLSLPVVRFGGIVVAVLLGFGAVGVSLAYMASFVAASALGLWYLVRHTSLLSLGAEFDPMYRELLSFSAPLVVSATMTVVFTDIDLLMLGALRNLGDTGVYNVVYPLAHLLMVALAGFAFLFMPALSSLHSDGRHDRMAETYQIVTKWVFVITLPVFLVQALFPTLTIKLTFGPEYAAGSTTLSILAAGFFVHALLGPNGETLTAIGRTKTIMWANVATAAANVVLNLLLIPAYGFLGAGIATAASYAVLNGIYSVQLYRLSGIQPFTPRLVRPGAVGVVAVAAVYLVATRVLSPTLPVVVSLLFVFLAVYFVGVLRFGVEEAEIAVVLDLERRFGIDLGPAKRLVKAMR